jgi:alkyl hydroperoxide reductase subunit AhpF
VPSPALPVPSCLPTIFRDICFLFNSLSHLANTLVIFAAPPHFDYHALFFREHRVTDLQHHRLIILGSGPAGYTAAVYAARAGLDPVLITGMQQGGQLTTTTEVENWPGGAADLQGPQLMQDMLAHVERLGVNVIFDHIEKAALAAGSLLLAGSHHYSCDALVIATGASAQYLGLPSEAAVSRQGRQRLRDL